MIKCICVCYVDVMMMVAQVSGGGSSLEQLIPR